MTRDTLTEDIMQSNLVAKDAHDSTEHKSEAMSWYHNAL